ncbi:MULTISPECIES: bifunctional diguanylate cyclase/phosphodiesterase [unclassified Chelatococcus]|uniref:bifunctional diguanylate cyclase/phosphodiesterase n=1 Tax=unclassified Chelatococcus TaxID=2638111 RepID=UPI001BD09C8F|nr:MULTISPECIES: bifunctional diguanylate cyclase/phosphodiesterase [unclassified Chelatococcus]MBS7697266.1 bifunctional diguanylate cyclase/phosphodiesterase [Chelatococcus sp. YT9]MBX3556437.1 bifunctional diguanylate cyclase/phosphodiesterase [Chelatococcus sp.]
MRDLQSECPPDAGAAGVMTNWAHLAEALASGMSEAGRSGVSFTLLVLALDNLDDLNGRFGSDAADEALNIVAGRVGKVARRRDQIIRHASNRFAVLLRGCPVAQVRGIAERMARAVEATPANTRRGAVQLRVRMGAAQVPDQGCSVEALLHHASDALRSAKQRFADGRRSAEFALVTQVIADQEVAAPAVVTSPELGTLVDPVRLLNEQQVMLAGQPVVSAKTHELAFHEALVRIRLADGTIMGAAEAVPLAERHGVIPLFDYRVLQLAVNHLIKAPTARLAINISPLTLRTNDTWAAFTAHLGANPSVAQRLIVELTETAAIDDPHIVQGRLATLKLLGVTIAIDDFGSGHTSFRHLRSFPVDILKIDGSFVCNLSRSREDRFFTRTLVELAQHLGIATVAEWVEDRETASILADWGVTYLQGDYIGPAALWDEGPQLSTARRRRVLPPLVDLRAS